MCILYIDNIMLYRPDDNKYSMYIYVYIYSN